MSRQIIITGILLFHILTCWAQDIERVKEINKGPNGSSYPHNFSIANNKLFFIATDEVNYTKLWVSEGSDATTTFLGPAAGVIGSISGLIAYKDKVYFTYDDGINGAELWVSDGTVTGTQLFKDLYPGSTGSFPRNYTVANNKLLFMADAISGQRRLFVCDGTVAGTKIIRDNYIDVWNGLDAFAILNNDIYFNGDDGTGSGNGIWKSDGTLAGTKLVKKDIGASSTGNHYAVLNNKLYFAGFEYVHGTEIWVTDGTDAGTHLVKNIGVDYGGVLVPGAPPGMFVYNSKIYFAGKDDAHGAELWVTDGTDPGTHLVKDIYPGPDGSKPYEMIVYNGFLYMLCSLTNELWQSDGTEAGTHLVKTGLYYSKFSGVWNGKMYLTNETFDNLVIESDGTTTGTVPLKVQNTNYPVYSSGSDLSFTEYNGELYFSGSCPTITLAYEPCKLTVGTAAIKAFSFTGNGNWSNPANWSGSKIPPAILPPGYTITITGQCILDITQHIQTGASITVATGGSLVIPGSLTLQ